MKKSYHWNQRRTGIRLALFVILVFVSLYAIGYVQKRQWKNQWLEIQDTIRIRAEQMYVPTLYYQQANTETSITQWIVGQAMYMQPFLYRAQNRADRIQKTEDEETVAMILASQANDENTVDTAGNLVEKEETANVAADTGAQAGDSGAEARQEVSSIDMSVEKLRDFNYLLSNFYTVDSTTMIDGSQLNVDDLLSRNMKIDRTAEGPKILIFHTHSQETFADSVAGDTNTSIVGIGAYLTEQLNARGIPAIHHDGVYDIINGELDRSNAYEYAEAGVRQILADNPTVEVAIDLHRDGVAEGTHLVTEVNGKQTAQIMFFNGLSRTKTTGDIDYLYNPYIQDNLSFSFQMQLACESQYPGFARRIYLRGYRYNLHLMPKSLLIEAGAQTNTVEEMKNAMDLLVDSLYRVLVG